MAVELHYIKSDQTLQKHIPLQPCRIEECPAIQYVSVCRLYSEFCDSCGVLTPFPASELHTNCNISIHYVLSLRTKNGISNRAIVGKTNHCCYHAYTVEIHIHVQPLALFLMKKETENVYYEWSAGVFNFGLSSEWLHSDCIFRKRLHNFVCFVKHSTDDPVLLMTIIHMPDIQMWRTISR